MRNIELASTAAEVITLIATSGAAAGAAGASNTGSLGSYTAAAVRGLAELLKECAAHAYALGMGRRKSNVGAVAADVRASMDRRDHSLSPVQEAAETAGTAVSSRSNSSTYVSAGLGLLGTVWSGDRQQQQQQRGLANQSSLVFRHSSLNRDGTTGNTHQHTASGSSNKQQDNSCSSTPPTTSRMSLTSGDRISSTSVGMSGGHCLVNSHEAHESCGFCPMSSTLMALCTLLTPVAKLQQQMLAAGCVEVLVGRLAGEVCHVSDHSRLLGALAHLTALAVQGNTQAQDQVRSTQGCGGLMV